MWKLHRTDFPGVRRLVSCHVYWLLSARKSKCLASEVVVWCRKRMQYNHEVVIIFIQWLWFDVERGCNTTMEEFKVKEFALWFDVERGCNTTYRPRLPFAEKLWFDVERGCNTTSTKLPVPVFWLWFDVERGCNTTRWHTIRPQRSCGLM